MIVFPYIFTYQTKLKKKKKIYIYICIYIYIYIYVYFLLLFFLIKGILNVISHIKFFTRVLFFNFNLLFHEFKFRFKIDSQICLRQKAVKNLSFSD